MTEIALSSAKIERFIVDGFVRIDEAFPRDLASTCRTILWRGTGCREDDPSTWTQPVVRLGMIPNPHFREAANTPTLHAAFDALVGRGRWQPCGALGTFPIRFPSDEDPGDDGWHVDASFGFEDEPDFLNRSSADLASRPTGRRAASGASEGSWEGAPRGFMPRGGGSGDRPSEKLKWRLNVTSRGRALLMLFLFSDVGDDDAPTRLRVGSHRDVARRLAPHGDAGLSVGDFAVTGHAESAHCAEARAVGPAGTVYLCHPFLVHAGQRHRGRNPRFLAQPPLLPTSPLDPMRPREEASPVESAIRRALT